MLMVSEVYMGVFPSLEGLVTKYFADIKEGPDSFFKITPTIPWKPKTLVSSRSVEGSNMSGLTWMIHSQSNPSCSDVVEKFLLVIKS
ncbi:unnamed protein product [Brassica oleracea var. botrytis]|nr:unnamed protein product [Brassica napus]